MKSKQKILIVDDDARNRKILLETLEDLYELKAAASGEEALALAEGLLPDLVLLDIMMPSMNGYDVCRKMRSEPKFKFTKIILVSGKAMLDERLQGYEAGADDYISKPFAPEELLAKTQVFLRLTSAETELDKLNRNLDEKVREKTDALLAAEAKLMNAAKMSALGEMAGGVAHEINTPLTTIALVIGQIQEFLNEEPVDKAAAKHLVGTAEKTVKKIGGIIDGLRNFSRDGSRDSFETASLKEIVDGTLSLCNEKLKHLAVSIEVKPYPEDLKLSCRAVQISQILLNLIGNAMDAVAGLNEKWIRIEAVMDSDTVRIFVTDSGPGIPEAVRAKAFQPFFTTKPIGKGTGLGLSVSRGIAEQHGGTLEIDESCGNTRFVLSLPVDRTLQLEKAS